MFVIVIYSKFHDKPDKPECYFCVQAKSAMPLLDDDVTLSSTTGGAKSIAHAGQASQPAQAQTQSQSSLARVALGKGTTPAVASARLSAKTLKEFTSVKSLIEKAVDEATKLLSKM